MKPLKITIIITSDAKRKLNELYTKGIRLKKKRSNGKIISDAIEYYWRNQKPSNQKKENHQYITAFSDITID